MTQTFEASRLENQDLWTSDARVLYMCDFIPSNTGGGAVLMQRLLSSFPAGSFSMLCGWRLFSQTATGGNHSLEADLCSFPTFSGKGRWGLGRIRSFLDWVTLPLLVLVAISIVKAQKRKAIFSVAHGQFFLGAALVARLTGIPLVLWVHDDWVAQTRQNSYVLVYFSSTLFRLAVRSATHIYCISDAMAEWLQAEYGVVSEIQMPGAYAVQLEKGMTSHSEIFRIAYAGTLVAGDETVTLLVDLLNEGGIREDRRVHLDLYLPPAESNSRWQSPYVTIHPWLSQAELKDRLSKADLLFLPYNFSEREHHITTRSFPTKAADYLACDRPILLMAPASSAIVLYARQHAFAHILDEPSSERLAACLKALISDHGYREAPRKRAQRLFNANHNIVRQGRDVHELLNRITVD